jgi:biopolymer transport protein ExbB
LSRYKGLVNLVVVVAPLLGLLGTVSGMIETFDSLAEMSLFSQSGGIAGGISQALITTQMGLAVAIPGLIAGKLLERRQTALIIEMEETIEKLWSPIENQLTNRKEVAHA